MKVMDETIRVVKQAQDVIAEFQRRLVKPFCDKFLSVYLQDSETISN